MQGNPFLKANLVQSFGAFKRLYAAELFQINLKLALGYASFTLPVIAVIIFFYLHWDADAIPASSQYVFFLVLFVSLFFPGLFYFVFEGVLKARKRSIFDNYHQYGDGAAEIVLSGRPFILYARGFEEERNLGNRSSTGFLDNYFSVQSVLEEEMDKRTDFSFFPAPLATLLDKNGYPVVALGHSRLKRGLASVRLLFCRDAVWEQVIQELANEAALIILNTLERNGDYWRKPMGPGVEKEMDMILNDSTLANKTFVMHNDFEKMPPPNSLLSRVMEQARWASPFNLHDPATQRYRPPVGEVPGELKEWIETHQLAREQN